MSPATSGWAAASLIPLLASALSIPEASTPAPELAARNPSGMGKCTFDSYEHGWCALEGFENGCWDDECSRFNAGQECYCEEPHRRSTDWGCAEGTFCPTWGESGCEGEKGDIEADVPVDSTNPLVEWCDAGNEIPLKSIVAGVYENTMIYVCNFLNKDIGCDHYHEVKAGIDAQIVECGNGHPGWAFSRNWNKSYGMAVNGSDVCTNIDCTDVLYIDENGEIQKGDCQETQRIAEAQKWTIG